MAVRGGLQAMGCGLAAAGGGWVLWDQLGIRALVAHVPQQYGPGHATVAFVGAAGLWLCVHAAALALRSRPLAPVHGAALALAVASVAFLHWPQGHGGVGYFVVRTVDDSQWGRDVEVLLGSMAAGLVVPTVVALRRRRPQPSTRAR